jgi:hypothetical protein
MRFGSFARNKCFAIMTRLDASLSGNFRISYPRQPTCARRDQRRRGRGEGSPRGLADLHDRNVISDQEFNQEKAKVMAA